jgi:dTMP kinase
MRGLLIVFEGVTGAGKKTHIKLLAEKLKTLGKEVSILSFPDYENPIAKLTRKADLDPYTQSLLFAADRQLNQQRIKALLEKGNIILCDRYCYSNYAYQSALGVDLKWLMQIEKNVIKPDLAFLIDVPVETSIKRVQQASIEDFTKKEILSRLQKQREILEKIRENFLEIAKRNKETEWHILDGRKDIAEVDREIWEIVKRKIFGTEN